jgi:predicted HD phosphohydrolase
MKVENGPVTFTVDDIERLLASGATRPVEVEAGTGAGAGTVAGAVAGVRPTMPFSQLDHALQTASVLRAQAPEDQELAVAGLVHDVGHLLAGVGDVDHADAGAAAVRVALGERVAGLVGLHVAAKRYLVARQGSYGGTLAADSVASLARQGGPMPPIEQSAFERLRYARDALVLRRADESGKVEGLVVLGLGDWMPIVRRVAQSARTS